MYTVRLNFLLVKVALNFVVPLKDDHSTLVTGGDWTIWVTRISEKQSRALRKAANEIYKHPVLLFAERHPCRSPILTFTMSICI